MSCSKNIPENYNWASSIELNSIKVKSLEQEFELKIINNEKIYDFKYAQIVWRYRDDRVIPYLNFILKNGNTHLKCMAIRTLGRIENEISLKTLSKEVYSDDEIVKTYSIMALSRTIEGRKFLKESKLNSQLILNLNNIYLSNISLSPIRGMPIIDSSGFKKEPFIYKTVTATENNFKFEMIDSTKIELVESGIAKPTDAFFDSLSNTPRLDNFWIESLNQNHSGYDNSWDWQGLPVLSATDGVVRVIWYDVSWGFMVAIESIIMKQNVLIIYGHLDSRILVLPGQMIKKGNVIGEIGGATTIVNGGYRSHLHFGIEKCLYPNCTISGYDSDRMRWIDPRLIAN